MKETIKNGTIKVVKVDGIIKEVETDFHIDELFKIINYMRTGLGKNNDVLKDMQRMGWPVPQLNKPKSN